MDAVTYLLLKPHIDAVKKNVDDFIEKQRRDSPCIIIIIEDKKDG
jgi:hypothetical protein